MKEKLEQAIKINAEKAGKEKTTADEALKFTQSAVNAANALRNVVDLSKE